ncbi:MAG: hypothetical protein ACQEQ7_06430, partial [Thermodesulfobacteriota bacterium]
LNWGCLTLRTLIVHAFNLETYGEMGLDPHQMRPVRHARRRLHSPVHWFARFKSWFFQSNRFFQKG